MKRKKGMIIKTVTRKFLLEIPTLINAELKGVCLRYASLWTASLSGADLEGADLRGAELIGANFKNAKLVNANFRKADLSYADLSGADLSGADLREADFTGTILCNCNLHNAMITFRNKEIRVKFKEIE